MGDASPPGGPELSFKCQDNCFQRNQVSKLCPLELRFQLAMNVIEFEGIQPSTHRVIGCSCLVRACRCRRIHAPPTIQLSQLHPVTTLHVQKRCQPYTSVTVNEETCLESRVCPEPSAGTSFRNATPHHAHTSPHTPPHEPTRALHPPLSRAASFTLVLHHVHRLGSWVQACTASKPRAH